MEKVSVVAMWACLMPYLTVAQHQGQEKYLVVANRKEISRVQFDSSNPATLVPRQISAVGVDFDHDTGYLYWTDGIQRNIQRSAVTADGHDVEVVVKGLGRPDGVAVDWVNKKIYWTDPGTNNISVSDLNGASCMELIATGLQEPRAIVVHPYIGYMFWTDWGQPAKIEKCGMDGRPSTREVLIDRDIVWPNALAIDYTEEKIWWVDARLNTIESSDFNGQGRRVLLRTWITNHAYGATIFQDFIYWTRRTTRKIYRANKFTGQERTVVASDLYSPRGIVVYHQHKQPAWVNPCSAVPRNKRCSHICLLTPSSASVASFSCHCPAGIQLLDDQRTCNSSDMLGCRLTGCLNGGSCIQEHSSPPSCRCTSNYKGVRCETAITTPTTEDKDISTTASSSTQPDSTVCRSHQHQCNSTGACIPKRLLCDGKDNCPDKSDEIGCPPSAECTSNQFRCLSGECINHTLRCDGADDCLDHSDEVGCLCRSNEFQCRNTSRCIPDTWQCDGDDDCKDMSDEFDCQCRRDEFQCTTGKCIPKSWRCDGADDCDDDTDEVGCVCKSDEFQCNTGQCILHSWRCDGDDDCTDKSDEADCSTKGSACKDREFQCKTDGKCITQKWLCDGEPDCPDGSDERNCSSIGMHRCKSDEFQCQTSKQCLHKSRRCDREADCPDRSDEFNCSIGCGSEEFQCATGVCIPQTLRCDGHSDCNDTSDEAGCSLLCQVNAFWCTTGGCVTGDDVCDGVAHCSDGSDEKDCGSKGFLLFSNSNDVRRISFDASNYTVVIPELKAVVALDYDFSTGYLYWSDVQEFNIRRAPMDNISNVEEIVRENSLVVEGIAVDWINKKLYWTRAQPDVKIEVSDVSGANRAALITNELEKPRAIVLHPLIGYMFWSDWGTSPAKIEKCGMDGNATSRQIVVNKNIVWPNGLTIDYTTDRIWWVDAKLATVESADFNGHYRRVMLRGLHHPFGITIFQSNIYWTDWSKEAVYKANKYNGSEITLLVENLRTPMDIVVYNRQRQPVGDNPCSTESSAPRCSHICLLAPRFFSPFGFSCHCPPGYELLDDKRTCNKTGSEDFLLLSTDVDIRRISFDASHYRVVISELKRVVALDYDFSTGYLYWSDVQEFNIRRAPMDNISNVEEIVRENSLVVEGIAVDWINKKLYWTRAQPDVKIEVSDVSGANRAALITNELEKPRAIVLHPLIGYMFWSDWGTSPAKIEKCGMDGNATSRQIVVNKNIVWPNGLTIDYTTDRIWWVDAKLATVESADFNGHYRRVMLRGLHHPFGITIFQSNIYWTDWSKEAVYKANKYNGSEITLLVENLRTPMDIVVYSRQRQPVGDNPCSRESSAPRCSHICLLALRFFSPVGFSCHCPPGYELLDDQRTCNRTVLLACKENSCANGGTCVEGINTPLKCSCPSNFTGVMCQTNVPDANFPNISSTTSPNTKATNHRNSITTPKD